jgi:hypothetical protein
VLQALVQIPALRAINALPRVGFGVKALRAARQFVSGASPWRPQNAACRACEIPRTFRRDCC